MYKQRPTASELLRHPFIQKAKKTAYLQDLVDRHKAWKKHNVDMNDEEYSSNEEDDT